MLLLRKDAYAAPALLFPPAPGVVHLARPEQLLQSRKPCGWGGLAFYTWRATSGQHRPLQRSWGGKSKYLVVIPLLPDGPSYPSAHSPMKLMTVPVPPDSHCGIRKMRDGSADAPHPINVDVTPPTSSS